MESKEIAKTSILSPLRLPFRHIGAASMILAGFYRAPKAIWYSVHEYLWCDFTRGYSHPGGTSCPDKLFGAPYSQGTIVSWVEANV